MPYAKRPGDRHKKTEERKKDRHKKNSDGSRVTPRKRPERPPWAGNFIAVDGEGWDGKYTILAMSGRDPLVNLSGLSTLDCLDYLTSHESPSSALIGFGLSYDFENILKDIPDEDYLKLKAGDTIEYGDYDILYIPRKILQIKKINGFYIDEKNKRREMEINAYIQDVFGFFQSSFITALEKWGIEVPDFLARGKSLRGEFSSLPLEDIIRYNEIELEKLILLMEKLREADAEACNLIGIRANHTPRGWYGPGARAANFLNQTGWVAEHPDFDGAIWEKLKEATGIESPFASAFFGGRIETAYKGVLEGNLWDYDIISAYPFALSRLPKWAPGDLLEGEGYDQLDRMGMYYVKWNILDEVGFYPFPFRSQNGNVFFPPSGEGWYMSPEVSAAVKIYGPEQVKVFTGYVLDGTEGSGAGTLRLPPEKLCGTAKKMLEMAEIRIQAKADKRPAEKVLKLIMNSCYGKTIQQVGSMKHLNVFAAAWITSVCRSMLVMAIGKDTQKNVISCMTDGILSMVPLSNIRRGLLLGEWEQGEFRKVIQFLPGVYLLEKHDGTKVKKYRGMSRDFDALTAVESFYNGIPWEISLRVFVTRSLAIHMPGKFEGHRYEFFPVSKLERFCLESKREDPEGELFAKNELYKFCPAKRLGVKDFLFGSKPYPLKSLVPPSYDESKSIEELFDGSKINEILEAEIAGDFRKMKSCDKKAFRKAIRELGGVSDKDYEVIPRWARRKKGLPLDELATELKAYGYEFEDGDQLHNFLLKH